MIFAILILAPFVSLSQSHYWVMFKDKPKTEFNPHTYFDPHTIQKRERMGISLSQFSDWPVSNIYVSKISALADSQLAVSRWLNGMAIIASREAIEQIVYYDFVKEVIPVFSNTKSFVASAEFDSSISHIDSAILELQLRRMQSDEFTSRGFTGLGVRIAIFDVGFKKANVHPAFEHIRKSNRIIKTFDFINKSDDVYRSSMHGTMVMSCIGGMYGEIPIGMATASEFLLARTERFISEFRSEEYNWLLAAEWADKHGADIINSSLGYTFHRYFPEQMTGSEAIISRAAGIAASKGILVVNAAGNEGEDSWRIVAAPADNDSVLSVGGTHPLTDTHIGFSSFGPTSDGTLKPNVCAFGLAVVASKRGYGLAQGTSFSAPLVAGFAACGIQANKQLKSMELFYKIEQSGHLFPYYDPAHGFGIPQAAKYFNPSNRVTDTTFRIELSEGFINVKIDSIYLPEPGDTLGQRLPKRNLYYHIRNKKGRIYKYAVLLAEEEEVIFFRREDLQDGDVIMLHFEGFTIEYKYTRDE